MRLGGLGGETWIFISLPCKRGLLWVAKPRAASPLGCVCVCRDFCVPIRSMAVGNPNDGYGAKAGSDPCTYSVQRKDVVQTLK